MAAKPTTQVDTGKVGASKSHQTEKQMSTTRICIKNVPPNFTESKLRSHLVNSARNSNAHTATDLIITDCKILRTKDGKSRKLAFVGFKDEEMAKYAISYFDKSFAATSRLVVEAAFSKSNPNEHYRPWSKHSQGSSRYDALHENENVVDVKKDKKKKKDGGGEKEEVVDEALERKKREFIDVMMGGKKSSSNLFWANDDGGNGNRNGDVDDVDMKGDGEDDDAKADDDNSEDESDDDDNSDSDDSDGSNSDDSDDDSFDVMKTYKKEAKNLEPVSDMDFLRSKVVSEKEILSDDDGEDKDENGDENANGSDSSSAPSSSDDESDDSSSSSDEDDGADDNEDDEGEMSKSATEIKHSSHSTTNASNIEEPITTERAYITREERERR